MTLGGRRPPIGLNQGNRRRRHQPDGESEHGIELDARERRRLRRLLLAGFDRLAKRTGMLAVKGVFHRLNQGDFLRPGKQHACPGQALQQRPVDAERQAERRDHEPVHEPGGEGSGHETRHGGEPSGGAATVNHAAQGTACTGRGTVLDDEDVEFLLSPDPIPDATPPFGPGLGAETRFLGVVRELEDDRKIAGIEYSAYRPMADKLLAELIATARAEREPHEVFLQHRLGFVAAGEPSILIRVRTRHSAAAFDLCRWYLAEIKTRVPIWKKPVFAQRA